MGFGVYRTRAGSQVTIPAVSGHTAPVNPLRCKMITAHSAHDVGSGY
jgi:hypothetical protein